jgi:hypothetical protein
MNVCIVEIRCWSSYDNVNGIVAKLNANDNSNIQTHYYCPQGMLPSKKNVTKIT